MKNMSNFTSPEKREKSQLFEKLLPNARIKSNNNIVNDFEMNLRSPDSINRVKIYTKNNFQDFCQLEFEEINRLNQYTTKSIVVLIAIVLICSLEINLFRQTEHNIAETRFYYNFNQSDIMFKTYSSYFNQTIDTIQSAFMHDLLIFTWRSHILFVLFVFFIIVISYLPKSSNINLRASLEMRSSINILNNIFPLNFKLEEIKNIINIPNLKLGLSITIASFSAFYSSRYIPIGLIILLSYSFQLINEFNNNNKTNNYTSTIVFIIFILFFTSFIIFTQFFKELNLLANFLIGLTLCFITSYINEQIKLKIKSDHSHSTPIRLITTIVINTFITTNILYLVCYLIGIGDTSIFLFNYFEYGDDLWFVILVGLVAFIKIILTFFSAVYLKSNLLKFSDIITVITAEILANYLFDFYMEFKISFIYSIGLLLSIVMMYLIKFHDSKIQNI